MATIRGVLVKPYTRAKEFSFEYNNFMDLYPVLDCDTFDVAMRKFGDNFYDIYLDDNGLGTDKGIAIFTVSKTTHEILEMLVGNCFICNHDDKGDIISLTDDEVKEVLNSNKGGIPYCEL